MRYLLDTDICIALIKQRPAQALERLRKCGADDVAISTISVAELQYGVAKSRFPEQALDALREFVSRFEILDFDWSAATAYGVIRADLERKRTPIGPNDLLIAAQAVAHNLKLVSNNEREFSRVKDLLLENWLK